VNKLLTQVEALDLKSAQPFLVNVTMKLDNEPDVVLHARHVAQRIKNELEYTFNRILDNVESSVRSASGLFALHDLVSRERLKAHLVQYKAERAADDVFSAIPLAKMSVRPDKRPAASDAVPGNRSVSDTDCTLASVRHTSSLACHSAVSDDTRICW
jgi:hypothetical protein